MNLSKKLEKLRHLPGISQGVGGYGVEKFVKNDKFGRRVSFRAGWK
jgi:hypothetical protein